MAHLQTKETRNNPEQRLEFKWKLIRRLYERGYNKEDVRQLFRFIDWVMKLPEELGRQLDERIAEYEEEQKMPYITSIERRGIKKGLEQGLQQGIFKVLQARFQNISLPKNLVEKVKSISSENLLDMLLEQSVTVDSIPTFEQKVAELAGKNGQLSASSWLALMNRSSED